MNSLNFIILTFLFLINTQRSFKIPIRQELLFKRENLRKLEKFLGREEESVLERYLSVKYKVWNEGVKGEKVKIAIFDSGIKDRNICIHIYKIENFTDEIEDDMSGHGSYLTSLICNEHHGIAPHSQVFIYKVFNSKKKTYNTWLIDAFKMAIKDKVDIINLSFGGINFDEKIIIDQINEATEQGIIITSSAGNDGPSFGTINFPGNLPNVITVGAVSKQVFTVINISSRGPAIYKKNVLISKPNTWAPGEEIEGIDNTGELVTKIGSSVSTALVTGYIALLLSKFYESRGFFNVGSVLLLIKESNINNPQINKDEGISGLFSLDGILKVADSYINKKVQLVPQILNNIVDFTLDSFSIYSLPEEEKSIGKTQMYSTMQPVFFTLSFVNPINSSLNKITSDLNNLSNDCVSLSTVGLKEDIFIYQNHIGVMSLKLQINEESKCQFLKERIEMSINFKSDSDIINQYNLKLVFDLVPTPNRFSRILYTRYHNLYYPFDGYIPKDNLYDDKYNYDWTFESINTNYYNLYTKLKGSGYYLEESYESLDCINLSHYSLIIMIDAELGLTGSEIDNLRFHFENNHLSLFFITEWNRPDVLHNFQQTDEDTNIQSHPIESGSEIKYLNKFLENYGIKIGGDSISNEFNFNNKILKIKSATSISEFPSGSYLFGNNLNNDLKLLNIDNEKQFYRAVLGFLNGLTDNSNSGRISIFTDSYCIDDYQLGTSLNTNNCFWLIDYIVKFLIHGNYIYNGLDFKSKIKLNSDFNDESLRSKSLYSIENNVKPDKSTSNCCRKNFTEFYYESELTHFKFYRNTKTKGSTYVIPNLFNTNSFTISKRKNRMKIILDLLCVLSPIAIVILIIFLLINCKQRKLKRVRISMSISQLKSTASVDYSLSDVSDSTSLKINN